MSKLINPVKKILIIVGTNSHVLKNFHPSKNYEILIKADRQLKNNLISENIKFVQYDLSKHDENNILNTINEYNSSNLFCIDIIFASFTNCGLKHNSSESEIMKGLGANLLKPLKLFNLISSKFFNKYVSGVFISSMYAHVVPKNSNYDNKEIINPLYYGVAKAGVEQGIKWLSCQNSKHRFNSIVLGPMPKVNIQNEQKILMENLIKSLPTGKFVDHRDLHETINFLLTDKLLGLRGASIFLDGGYTLW